MRELLNNIFKLLRQIGLIVKVAFFNAVIFTKRHPFPILIFLGFTIAGSLIGIYRYMAYLDGFDFAVFYEAIYKYAQFQLPDTSVRGLDSFDGDHFHPIIVLITPIYLIFQSPYVLPIVQAIMVALSVFPVYFFIKRRFKNPIIPILALSCYVLSAGLQWMLFFDFHEILFAVPLIAWSIYLIDTKRWKWFLVCIALLAITKEEMYIFIASAGILLIVTRWHIKIGAILTAGGIVGFLVLNKIIMPLLAGKRSYDYWSYTSYGSSVGDAIKNFITQPILGIKQVASDLISDDARLTIAMWFKPLFYILPFFSPYILLAIPIILTRFLSDSTTYSVYTFHYGATVAPILFMSFTDSLSRLRSLLDKFELFKKSTESVVGIVLITSLTISLVMSANFNAPLYQLTNKPFENLGTYKILEGEKEVQSIIGQSSVMAPDIIAAHFANRDKIYTMRIMSQWDEPFDKIINPVAPSQAKFIILNSKLPLPDNSKSAEKNRHTLGRYIDNLKNRDFSVVYTNKDTGWIVLRNNMVGIQ